jgi:hypothetical protein
LVEHSPSTVIALNVTSVTAASARCSSAGSTAASVVTTASIVAISGSIMPDPFAMPPTRKLPAPVRTSTAASFGKGSVVMIARAADGPPSRASADPAAAMPAIARSRSSDTPITPVEATSACDASAPTVRAAASAIASAVTSPSGPVHALAQPLLIAIARAWPPDARSRAIDTRTGAACARLVVKTAAAEAAMSLTISATSRPPAFLMPLATPAERNPAGAETPPSMASRARCATLMP